jgi:hypothetical protein
LVFCFVSLTSAGLQTNISLLGVGLHLESNTGRKRAFGVYVQNLPEPTGEFKREKISFRRRLYVTQSRDLGKKKKKKTRKKEKQKL